MSKRFLLICLLASLELIINSAESYGKWKLDPSAEVYCGSESNVYKSPENVGTITGLETRDGFINYKIGLEISKYLAKTDKFKLDYQLGFMNYFSHTVLNEYSHEIDFQYRHKFGERVVLKLNSGWDMAKKKATDVFGEDTTRLFPYAKYIFGPIFEFKTSPKSEIDIGYDCLNKDYEETGGMESLDYTQHELEIEVKLGGARRKLSLQSNVRLRGYKEYTARDKKGDQLSSYPKRKENYYAASIGYEQGLSRKAKAGVEYSYLVRKDPFQDYYTYYENGLGGNIKLFITEITELQTEATWKWRLYKVQEAAVPGLNPKLAKSYINLSINFTQKILPNLNLYLQYILKVRDTNVTLKTWTTDRDYKDTIIGTGLQAHFY